MQKELGWEITGTEVMTGELFRAGTELFRCGCKAHDQVFQSTAMVSTHHPYNMVWRVNYRYG